MFKNKLWYVILIISLLLVLFYTQCVKQLMSFYPIVEEERASVGHYYIYGQVFNIEGSLNISFDANKIQDVSLVLMNKKIEVYINTIYQIYRESISFKTSNKINTGILLDHLDLGKYYLVLKVHFKDGKVKYYSLVNHTKYHNLKYYTITNNGSNNYITINFTNKLLAIHNTSFLEINVHKISLPHNVYDIVIDPGHGGIDSGAVANKIEEDKINLAIGLIAKEELEKLGLKVKITRNGDYNPGGPGIDPYWDNGRVNIANNVRAKYLFSIHLNSAPYKMKKGGVEVYSPPKANYDLAKSIADNIVKYAKTTYSPNHLDKITDGVYVRTFTPPEIAQASIDSLSHNHKPYNITINTPYHYIIREPGGIMTNAYVDGRYKKYNENHYYNSNVGVESYLIELGFMVNGNDLYNMVHNKKGYALGITEGICKFLYNDYLLN